MADGFLGRWAQRKQAVREGRAPEEPVSPVSVPVEPGAGMRAEPQPPVPVAPVAEPAEPRPTLQDVQTLTPQSDFTRFVAPDVAPEVRNAAMRKLFADPHFNVMDGLDIYIDDYSIPDPLPMSMMRKLASAQFLGLFEEEKKPGAAADPATLSGASPAMATPTTAAQSAAPDAAAAAPEPHETEDHVDPDLRLQQDHAAGPEGPGGSPQ